MKNKSLLFGEISPQDINKITERHFSSAAVDFELLKGGMFNTTYSVRLENGEKLILRIGPARRDVLLPFEQNLARAEKYSCELLEKAGIPANRPLASDFSCKIIPRDYMIFEFIEGAALSDKSIKRRNKPKLYRKTGELTKRFHQITGEYFGRISDSFRGVTYSSWSEYLFAELREMKNACIKNQVFTEDEYEKICAVFEAGKSFFDAVKEPRFVHADLWAGNIMVNPNGTDIAAVIDTDRCIFGDSDMDLANPWMINGDFLSGYGDLPTDENREIKLLYYRLFYAVIDTYVWKAEYCNRAAYKKSRKTVKFLIKKISKAIK